MRGEHSCTIPMDVPILGSSPHARGAPVVSVGVHATGGIIPACAGSTPLTTRLLLARWDHPRMRGEHT